MQAARVRRSVALLPRVTLGLGHLFKALPMRRIDSASLNPHADQLKARGAVWEPFREQFRRDLDEQETPPFGTSR
jgi:hypothetical protein